MNFFDKLLNNIERNQSLLYLELDPNPESLPKEAEGKNILPKSLFANPPEKDNQELIQDWWEWLDFLITETEKYVCAYKLSLGYYQSLGIPGLELLQQTLKIIPSEIPIILDAKHGDLNTSTVFAQTIFADWQVDACTISPYTGLDLVAPFLLYPGKAVFLLCATANPSAAILQEYPHQDQPLYLKLVAEAQRWATPEQLGLEVGIMPNMVAKIRQAAPERLILIQGDIAEENDITNAEKLTQLLAAGLNINGEGLLLPIPPKLLVSRNYNTAIESLRDTINEQRLKVVEGSPTCELWLPDVCFLQHEPNRDLILQLYDIGCIIFGDHVQASGAIFPYYIDLRKIISIPQIFHKIVTAYAEILKDLEFDRIAGIPYGSLPTATGLALRLERPMIFPRKEVKAYGTARLIEGHFQPGEKIVVVDDIMISGNSVIKGAEKLKSVGLQVEDIVVFIDHERGVKDKLQEHGYRGHSVLTLTEIAQTLHESNKISSEQFNILKNNH
ncbi:MAG: bifunctional orotidine-5'-phosphate decarboxylase/orotate phosphoribosyltransferase [Okeania sp. SIO3I5]|uniref:bifunctional orotidine-5'-phosphate decarboxylase/orotate phosphoribosyltransferase n=1 Tax=Okeania sp. SIO3I5 TaxID=2607805 RepID=UPI0013B673E6|nr:bifunctional orotidine-5'-phosphate decarboxylase/orotate phosphoribosyltransferase [Okeania sp. SIO3I5]NEQ35249.1 bifunctional orotidine-5'-phosphate decarboxylase/orotate phosphoribosyltransferase [Okeania sp. SIO3I5]